MQGSQKTAIAFALGRIAFGAGLIAAPQRVAKGWLAQDAQRPPTQVAIRGLGARDIALAGGVVLAAREDGALRPWLVGCLVCDLADIASTLAAGSALPARARWGTVALGRGAAIAGAALTARVER
jgi:hypothetical protein